jgi:hypothetical protein
MRSISSDTQLWARARSEEAIMYNVAATEATPVAATVDRPETGCVRDGT